MAVKSNWITIISNKRNKKIPSKIEINKDGSVFLDGELYDPENSKYKNLNISVEKYNKLNLGEETQKMIDSQEEAVKGETKVISEMKDKNRTELTTVKF
ncbi:MAG: hypothetical protein CVU88_06925 [Firmicutes bacterium HGW-Firmicutes-13]|nr:MAG: hypothetical protein CVU88_06925 [Firmicutes bacterium HGW-Firmicutes-13]